MYDYGVLLYYFVLITATAMIIVGTYRLIGLEVSVIVLGFVLFIIARDAKNDGVFGGTNGE